MFLMFKVMIDDEFEKMSKAAQDAIDNLSPEDIEKYFPKDTKSKGWISIEDHLPKFLAKDISQGYTEYKVKRKDGIEGLSDVSDHNTWYYLAKEQEITHWWNN